MMKKEKVDLIVLNAKVYTLDEDFSIVEAFAVEGGIIIETGNTKDILKKYRSDNILNLEEKFVYPGFIDAHCHFYGYGRNLSRLDLRGTESFQEVIDKTYEYAKTHTPEWIIGRGWDHNNWESGELPVMEALNKLFPDRPVILYRVDGHAALVNAEALKRAGIPPSGVEVKGGKFIKSNNILTGVLIDNAIDLINKVIPPVEKTEIESYLLNAQKKCFEVGLTSVHDAGLDLEIVKIIDSLQQGGKLKMRMYCMLNPDEKSKTFVEKNGIYKTNLLNLRSVKLYADGALGSYGACLISPYSDVGNHGLILHPVDFYEEWCHFAFNNNLQVCTHAIGDSANRLMLQIYHKYLNAAQDKRWRIEHAQVVNPRDLSYFDEGNIIASVQPVHATSDMYWAEKRLGKERIMHAYSYKSLLDQSGWIALGSDFPVEPINPLFGFYAAVSRKDHNNYPADGFLPEQALSRKEALRGMTIWAAKSAFEENEKGSLEAGKYADFVIMENDIMICDEKEIPHTLVIKTFINGKIVFER